jgi:hypothetical protein
MKIGGDYQEQGDKVNQQLKQELTQAINGNKGLTP